jgi:DNA-binding response OmpR family regulator
LSSTEKQITMAVKRAKKSSRAVSPETSAVAADPTGETAAGPTGGKQGGKRILLVDDDPEIVESMRAVLESRGYRILVARDGNQGLVLAEGQEPDLVVLDMMMPKRSGFLVLEKLRRSRPNPMRVIMITANEGSRHKAYAEMLGVDDYIRKPFAMDRLLESVDRLLS